MKAQLAHTLGIPETEILKFKHREDHYNVITTDGRKFQVLISQLTPEPEPDEIPPERQAPTPLVKAPPVPTWARKQQTDWHLTLNKLTRTKLRAIAEEHGVENTKSMNKQPLVDAIIKALSKGTK